MSLEQLVTFEPAWDKRDPNPAKNYGVHGVELRMVLKGEKGAVQFVLYTGWQLPHVTKENDERILQRARRGAHPLLRNFSVKGKDLTESQIDKLLSLTEKHLVTMGAAEDMDKEPLDE